MGVELLTLRGRRRGWPRSRPLHPARPRGGRSPCALAMQLPGRAPPALGRVPLWPPRTATRRPVAYGGPAATRRTACAAARSASGGPAVAPAHGVRGCPPRPAARRPAPACGGAIDGPRAQGPPAPLPAVRELPAVRARCSPAPGPWAGGGLRSRDRAVRPSAATVATRRGRRVAVAVVRASCRARARPGLVGARLGARWSAARWSAADGLGSPHTRARPEALAAHRRPAARLDRRRRDAARRRPPAGPRGVARLVHPARPGRVRRGAGRRAGRAGRVAASARVGPGGRARAGRHRLRHAVPRRRRRDRGLRLPARPSPPCCSRWASPGPGWGSPTGGAPNCSQAASWSAPPCSPRSSPTVGSSLRWSSCSSSPPCWSCCAGGGRC